MIDGAVTQILIMEDDPGLCRLLQNRLERQGYGVSVALNGQEGLSMAASKPYDLLIVDYHMPVLGGIEVIRMLGKTNQLPATIMITGEGNEEIAVESIKLGAADYIVKDVELKFLDVLPSVINQVLYRQQLIQERRRLQETVRESEERYRQLFEHNPQPMWVFDIKSLFFLAVNDAAIRHYGYSREEFLGMNLEDICPPDTLPGLMNSLSDNSDPHIAGVWKHRRKDGTVIEVEMISHPILFGKRQARFSMVTDVTAQRKLEDELLKAEKLESLGVLAGGLAHDFNNLLTAILGNITLAKLDSGPGDMIYERMEEAERALEKARMLTQQLLTFSRGGAPVKKNLSIMELVRDVASFALHGSKSKCDFALCSDLWNVEADEGQLSQVFNNLIINADQAMPDGGTIKISDRNIAVTAADELPLAPGNYVQISIADQGIGISPQYLEKIFDPYFTTKEKGSGLGLATTYSIIKRHHGHISVDSVVKTGTTFHVYLPAAAGPPHKKPDMLTSAAGSGKILIMDDEDMVREVAGEILTRLGYDVSNARDGSEALDIYTRELKAGRRIDVVLMDLTIPGGMGGKEAVKRLCEIDPFAKAIVSSGYSNDPIMAQYSDYGFCGVISKPYTIAKLSDTIRKVITEHKTVSPKSPLNS